MLSRILRLLGEALAIALLGASIIAVLSFLAAKTPEQAISAGHPPMPPTWEAGVLNHGSYYQWYTISAHPFLFALSVGSLIVSAGLVTYITRHWLNRRRSAL
jgi:hypothetical protein